MLESRQYPRIKMKFQSANKARWNVSWNLLLPVLIALVFFAFTFSYFPFREKLQFDTDEGLNLMRSMLVVKGYPLYSQISSDQPPLFTLILGLVLRIAGFEVNPARMLVLLFSALLVWAGAQFLSLTSGKLSAILFLPLALIIPRYLELSVSVMIGVPSIAFALVSTTFIVFWHKNKKDVWLILSALSLVCSVLIKLFTGFLAPIIVIGLTISIYLDNQNTGFSWKTLRPVLIWSIWFGGLGLLLGLILVGPQNIMAIITPHISADTAEEFQGGLFTINTHLQDALPMIVFGLFGALVCIFKKNWLSLYPLAWAGAAYILLSFHSPVFYHHQLLITVPIALLGATGVGEGIKSLLKIKKPADLAGLQNILAAGAVVGLALTFNHYLPVLNNELMKSPQISDFTLKATRGKLDVLQTMEEYADQTNWVVTDMPIYAFRAHLPVPPLLATFSDKRLVTGSLTEEDILTTMREYNPEQVLMARFVIPPLETYLAEHYKLVLSEEFFRLFIRNDLAPSTIE